VRPFVCLMSALIREREDLDILKVACFTGADLRSGVKVESSRLKFNSNGPTTSADGTQTN